MRKSMPEQLSQGPRGLTYLPEFNIVIFALLLSFPWEFLQVPFYGGMPAAEHWQGVKSCTQASASRPSSPPTHGNQRRTSLTPSEVAGPRFTSVTA